MKLWSMLLELIQIEVQCSKNYFKNFLSEEAGVNGNILEKEPQKPHTKLEKYVYYIFTENICSAWNPMQVVDFCKKATTHIFSLSRQHNTLSLQLI